MAIPCPRRNVAHAGRLSFWIHWNSCRHIPDMQKHARIVHNGLVSQSSVTESRLNWTWPKKNRKKTKPFLQFSSVLYRFQFSHPKYGKLKKSRKKPVITGHNWGRLCKQCETQCYTKHCKWTIFASVLVWLHVNIIWQALPADQSSLMECFSLCYHENKTALLGVWLRKNSPPMQLRNLSRFIAQ